MANTASGIGGHMLIAGPIVRLIVALVATPLILRVAHRLEMPRTIAPFSVGYTAMVTAYAVACLEPFSSTPELLVLARHVCYLVSSVGMLAAAFAIRSWALERRRLDLR